MWSRSFPNTLDPCYNKTPSNCSIVKCLDRSKNHNYQYYSALNIGPRVALSHLWTLTSCGVEYMRKPDKTYENALVKDYQNTKFLNPLWQVIYHEGIRGNHILFKNNPGRTAASRLTLSQSGKGAFLNKVEEAASKFWTCSTILELQNHISSQDSRTQRELFRVYLTILDSFTAEHRKSLN